MSVASPTARLVAVVSIAVTALSMVAAVRFTSGSVSNVDTYFHLRIGAEFLDGWRPWAPGRLTEFGTAEWHPTQWLGQIGLAGAERALGLPGVSFVSGVAVIGVCLAVHVAARSQGSLVVAAALLPVVLFAALTGLSGRPQVVSFAFTAIVTALWLRAADHRRPPWVVVPLTWVWAMTHGMWVVSVLVSVVAVLGLALDRRLDARGALRHLAVPAASLVVAFLTPVGPAAVTAVLRVSGISEYFAEWGPTRFTDPTTIAATLLLLALLVPALRSREPLPWLALCLGVLSAAWIAYSIRTVPLGVMMLAPLVARTTSTRIPRTPVTRSEAGWIGAGTAVAVAMAALLSWSTPSDPRGSSAAHASVEQMPAGSVLLTDWGQGGYSLWRHPHLDVVMHGYGDMFTASEIARNADLDDGAPGWREMVRELDAHEALLPTDARLTQLLRDEAGWTVVAQDSDAPAPNIPAMVHLRAP